MRMVEYKERIIFHPAYYLDEILGEMNISTAEFANHMGMKMQEAYSLLDGEIPVTSDLAKKLEGFLGISSKMWENLQHNFDRQMRRISAEKKIKETKASK